MTGEDSVAVRHMPGRPVVGTQQADSGIERAVRQRTRLQGAAPESTDLVNPRGWRFCVGSAAGRPPRPEGAP